MRLSRLRRVLDQRYHSGGAPLAGVNVHRYSTTRLSCSAPFPAAALAAARRAARSSCFASPPVRQLGRDLQDVSVVSSCKPAGGDHHRRRLACDPKSIVGTCDQGGETTPTRSTNSASSLLPIRRRRRRRGTNR